MPIIIKCPNCKEDIGIAETSIGKRVQCPLCNKEFTAGKPTPRAEPAQPDRPAKPAQQTQPPQPPPKPAATTASAAQPQAAVKPKAQPQAAPAPASRPQQAPTSAAHTQQPPARQLPPQPRREPKRYIEESGDAEPAYASQPDNQWRQVLAVMLIVLFIAIGTWGACEMQKHFGKVAAASPQELLGILKEAAAQSDDARGRKLLWQVMTPEDQKTAQQRRTEVEQYLINQHQHDKDVIERLDTQGLWLVCLRSADFNAKNWKFTRTEMRDSKIGLLLFEDDFGNTAEIPIIHTLHGWRAQVAAFCLKRIENLKTIHAQP